MVRAISVCLWLHVQSLVDVTLLVCCVHNLARSRCVTLWLLLLLLLLLLLTAIGFSPGGSGYFTRTQIWKKK